MKLYKKKWSMLSERPELINWLFLTMGTELYGSSPLACRVKTAIQRVDNWKKLGDEEIPHHCLKRNLGK